MNRYYRASDLTSSNHSQISIQILEALEHQTHTYEDKTDDHDARSSLRSDDRHAGSRHHPRR